MRMTRGHVRGVTRGMEVIYMRMTRGHVRGVNVNYSQSLCPKLSISIKVEPEAILEEEVDARALHYIQSLIGSGSLNKETERMIKKMGVDKPDDKVKHLAAFRDVKSGKARKIHYKLSAKSPGIPGRLYAGLSCQSPWRPIRNMLIGESTWDADQSNC